MEINNETEFARMQRAQMRGPQGGSDHAAAQLLALFQMSDKRGQDLLLQIAGIHAARYPRVPK